MKIFFPLQVFFPSQAGGPANTIYWITKNLVKQGHQCVVVATNDGIQHGVPLGQWLEKDYGKVIYVKTQFLLFPISQICISLKNFRHADVVHLSSLFFPTAFITAFVARIFKKQIIWSPRGELDPPALRYSNLRKRPVLWLIKKLLGKYPVFHSTCEAETTYIQNTFGSDAKIVQIPNYMEIPPKIERDTSKYLLYIGRIHPKKAIDNLIRAAARSETFLKSDFVLNIAGKGRKEFENDLHELVKTLNLSNKIIFVGQVEGDAKQKLIADAYFTFMPSHTENFGNVVLESLAQETPVVASKGTPWEDLEKEKIGFWVNNSPEELGNIIEKILQMEDSVYGGYRKRSREFVTREFDISKNIDRWIDVYKSLE